MNAIATIHAVLTVVSKLWLQEGNDPPRLEVRCSDGSYLLVGWCTNNNFPEVFRAGNGVEDFTSIPAAESGLHPGELSALIDEVQAATEAHESNDRADYWEAYTPEGER